MGIGKLASSLPPQSIEAVFTQLVTPVVNQIQQQMQSLGVNIATMSIQALEKLEDTIHKLGCLIRFVKPTLPDGASPSYPVFQQVATIVKCIYCCRCGLYWTLYSLILLYMKLSQILCAIAALMHFILVEEVLNRF